MLANYKVMLQTKVWYGGPGQHENLRDVEAGILRQGFLFFYWHFQARFLSIFYLNRFFIGLIKFCY